MDHAAIEGVVEAAYEGAVTPERWPVLLARLAAVFRSHFADSFARSEDYTRFRGIAFGLDRGDYEQEFLGKWTQRNVWGKRKPVRVAGEVISTRQIISRTELLHSDMYNDYLKPRALEEGLRLAIWAGDGWIQDISLLRSFSAGPFDAGELALARTLLPHLQRAALVARRLAEAASVAAAGTAALDMLRHPVFLLDGNGQAMQWNGAAERLLAEEDGLTLGPSGLRGASPTANEALTSVLARAGRKGRRQPRSGVVRLARPSRREPFTLTALPLGQEENWALLRPPAILAIIDDPDGAPRVPTARLTEMFGLTEAEAALSAELLAGRTVGEIADNSGRSIHTVRTHLARLMAKTRTRRQAELIQLLMAIPAQRAFSPAA